MPDDNDGLGVRERWGQHVNTLSYLPLYLELGRKSPDGEREEMLSTATGFLVDYTPVALPGEASALLVTAWHVLSGRDANTNIPLDKDGRLPTFVRVHFASTEGEPNSVREEYDLDDERERTRWFEHPTGPAVDIAVLPLPTVPDGVVPACLGYDADAWPTMGDLTEGVAAAALDRTIAAAGVPLRIADRLQIIGFPFGDRGTWPTGVWTTAPIASEPTRGLGDLAQPRPGFLVDSRSRQGQSGAPVVLHLRPGDQVIFEGDVYWHTQEVTALVGVYSGRVHKDSDLGQVWSVQALKQAVTAWRNAQSGGGEQEA